jgi:predicted ATPase
MLKIPISGGPHTGKTTLLEALRVQHEDAYFVKEPAEIIIAEEKQKEEERGGYQGIYPIGNYPAFAPLVVAKSVELEAEIPINAGIVFQDRSLIDNVGYGMLNNFVELIPEVEKHVRAANNSFALFCEPVGTYTATEIRHEDPEQALETHEALSRAYDESGIEIVHLPAVSVPDRLQLVKDALAHHL